MKIVLAAIEEPLAVAWEKHFSDLSFVSIHRGSILNLNCDAVVSPANSFGFMDGGIDAVYVHRFGVGIQRQVQDCIRLYYGELPVGCAELFVTNEIAIPYMIAAPTMRVPMALPADTVNPYLATRAAIDCALKEVPPIKTLAFPGMGTGVGQVPPEICARQMRAAIDDVLVNPWFPSSWQEAQERHQRLYSDSVRDIQYE